MLNKKLISIIALVSLVLSTNVVTPARADSITYASDRLTTSHPAANATHTITFRPQKDTPLNGYFKVDLNSAFGNVTGVVCSGVLVASGAGSKSVRCQSQGATTTAATTTITLTGVQNPAIGSYTLSIGNYTAGDLLLERVDVAVAIVSNVVVTASVPSSLAFSVLSLSQNTLINGASTTAASATTSLQFGTLQVGTSSVLGQQLEVATNATYGYKVTVEQNQDLTSNSGATIDAFNMGSAPASPIAWVNPVPVLDSKNTYGHMGFTTDDATLSSTTPSLYTGGKWMGFTGTSTQEVMYHTGAADGTTQDKGMVKVAYKINISALQEAGDYTNTLIYVATPTF